MSKSAENDNFSETYRNGEESKDLNRESARCLVGSRGFESETYFRKS